MLDHMEQYEISRLLGHGKTYNIESGGTTGKTIIGEKKQRRDVKWKAEAKNKVLADYREYFDLQPKENAYKQNGTELKAKPKQLHDEFYVWQFKKMGYNIMIALFPNVMQSFTFSHVRILVGYTNGKYQ